MTQIGGSHYEGDFQHWDWVFHCNVGYFEACATKYLIRRRRKHKDPQKQIEDLKKAHHYMQKLLQLHEETDRGYNKTKRNAKMLTRLCDSYGVGTSTRRIITRIERWTCSSDIQTIIAELVDLIKTAQEALPEPASNSTGKGQNTLLRRLSIR